MTQGESECHGPMKNTPILVEGEGRRYEIMKNSQGQFDIQRAISEQASLGKSAESVLF